jgi:uncharacterized damage-inducible protein DinB
MHAKDAIRQTYGMSDMILQKYLADLADADLLVRPVAGQHHIAWQLGHLIDAERSMIEAIKPGSCPPLPDGFSEAHSRDEASTRSDDPQRFRTKDEYLRLMKAQRAATERVLEGLSDADLEAPAPERMRSMWPTVGAVLNLVGNHVMMHVGQFVGVRRKLNKPIAI